MKKFLAFILIFFGILYFNSVFAATILTDDFNSYIDGDLQGQGLWIGSAAYQVESYNTAEGSKAVYINASGNQDIYKLGASQTAGLQTIYINASSTTGVAIIYYRQFVGDNPVMEIKIELATLDVSIRNGISDYTSLGTLGGWNEWDYIQVEWKSDFTYRGNVNGGAWSSYITFRSSNSPDYIYIRGGGTSQFFIDYIAELPFGYIPPPPPSATTSADDIFLGFNNYFSETIYQLCGYLFFGVIVLSIVYIASKR